jgi:hypothetical protein
MSMPALRKYLRSDALMNVAQKRDRLPFFEPKEEDAGMRECDAGKNIAVLDAPA